MSLIGDAMGAAKGLIPGLPSGLGDLLSSFASAFTQETRLLKLEFGSGSGIAEGRLLPHRLQGWEEINEGFRYELEALSSDSSIPLDSLLGTIARVTILTDTQEEREICGLVTEARQEGSDGGFATYRLVIESGLAVLRHRITSRVFPGGNVHEVTQKILDEHLASNSILASSFALEDRCRGDYAERPFWMQFNESDEAYLKRIWAREGISFALVPSPEGSADHPQHTLVLFDDPLDLDQNPCRSARYHRADGTENRDTVTSWSSCRLLQAGAVNRIGWNHASSSMAAASQESHIEQGPLASTLEDYLPHLPLEDQTPEAVDKAAQTRMKALEGRMEGFHGEGTVRAFQAGTWFQLEDHPIQDADPTGDQAFVILRLETEAENNLPKDLQSTLSHLLGLSTPQASPSPTQLPCRNRFDCVRRTSPILPQEHPAPRPGLLSARASGPEG